MHNFAEYLGSLLDVAACVVTVGVVFKVVLIEGTLHIHFHELGVHQSF